MRNKRDRRSYTVLPYDPRWANQFKAESKVVETAFEGMTLSIEHIGSTAVPGMAGKPLIDMLAIVPDITAAETRVPAMEAAGYTANTDYLHKKTLLFSREINGNKLVNVHVFEQGHPHIQEMLDLRDYLASNPEEAQAYSRLKHALKSQYPDDYAGYRRGKDEYMGELLERMTVAKK